MGQLQIVEFANTSGLTKQANNYFRNVAPNTTKPQPSADTEVRQGALEASNVKPPESAVHLIGIMRQFEMLQKAISIAGEMNRLTVDQVAKVGG